MSENPQRENATAAVTNRMVEILTQQLVELRTEVKSGFAMLQVRMDQDREKTNAVCLDVARLKERIGLLAGGLVVLDVIIGAVAAWLGTRGP